MIVLFFLFYCLILKRQHIFLPLVVRGGITFGHFVKTPVRQQVLFLRAREEVVSTHLEITGEEKKKV